MEFLSFTPLLKSTLWGGTRIARLKRLPSAPDNVGESWEVSALPGMESVVDVGPHRGRTLPELVRQYGPALVGRSVYARFGDTFPLLVKFIDATRDLSIQVHPDDRQARLHGHPSGKAEMWFVMDSDPGAAVLLGLREPLTPDGYRRLVARHAIAEALVRHPARAGDCFHVPPGRIHAICRGTFLAEIQQTCDLTYRIYDYDRLDPRSGRPRELHTDLAADCIDYTVLPDYRTHYRPEPDRPVPLLRTPHFTTRLHDLTRPATLHLGTLDSFVLLIALQGTARLTDPRTGEARLLRAGSTLLIPADVPSVDLIGSIRLLETYVAC